MALLTAMIKTLMAALLVLAASALPGHAASFSMKRGLNLDQWTTWPGEDKWGDRQGHPALSGMAQVPQRG